jgi:hypothetical protein
MFVCSGYDGMRRVATYLRRVVVIMEHDGAEKLRLTTSEMKMEGTAHQCARFNRELSCPFIVCVVFDDVGEDDGMVEFAAALKQVHGLRTTRVCEWGPERFVCVCVLCCACGLSLFFSVHGRVAVVMDITNKEMEFTQKVSRC